MESLEDSIQWNTWKTQNKTIDLYGGYNTRINYSSVEMCIMAELKENISKKIYTALENVAILGYNYIR